MFFRLWLDALGKKVVVQSRRIEFHRRLDIDDVRENFILDLDQLERLRRDDR